MITIVDIVEQIRNKKDAKDSVIDDGNVIEWTPKERKDYVLPLFEIPNTRSKKSTRKKLSQVLAFIELTKHKRLAHGCTIMPIACTNKRLIKLCGSSRNVSNLIEYMQKIGLLEIESDSYQFNAKYEKFNRSKVYRYYYENELKIIEHCKNNGIEKYETRNDVYVHTVVEKFSVDNFDDRQVRFNSHLHLLKLDGFSVAEFEDYLTQVLYRNYPELEYYQRIADYINDSYYADDPNRQIHFTPNYTWAKNKYVRKIGIRATNAYVSAKKEDDENSTFNGYYRSQILERYGLNLEKDVSSSVPRITLSLNSGKWISEDFDIYKNIYDEYLQKKAEKEGVSINQVMPPFEKVRAAIKELHMRGYFDSANTIGNHTRLAMAEVLDKNEVDEEMRLLQKAVIEAEGGYLYGSEIFYHESCIYMDVLMELLEEGYEVWQCYDAWYAAKDGVTQEEFEAHVTELVARKAVEYMEADEYIRRKQINKESDRGLRHNVMILLNALYERMNNNSKIRASLVRQKDTYEGILYDIEMEIDYLSQEISEVAWKGFLDGEIDIWDAS